VKDFTIRKHPVQKSERHTGDYSRDKHARDSGYRAGQIAVPYIIETAANQKLIEPTSGRYIAVGKIAVEKVMPVVQIVRRAYYELSFRF